MITSKPISNERTDSMKKSADFFKETVLPLLKERYRGRWINCEDRQSDVGIYLDEFAGIDWLYVSDEGHIFGVCARVINRQGDSFSMRFSRTSGQKTELEKRVQERHIGAITPYLCIQVYNEAGNISIGICGVDDLLEMIKERNCRFFDVENATFASVKFSEMSCLYPVDIYTGDSWLKEEGLEI